ncbi:VOC family protein [Nocardia sp. CDC159]|uniref:VOC family protein n=1 Tax=Nocardia pulmonis TaxID=2951408 RepID=A0A9X2EGB4_9NOCA|nr:MULTISPECIES: VOC family protein [Nocardia]MCM6777658.1 VOC family protein [Nocardia pulmonis]MCM6790538.1 VOC family protein [Nocardia sp. CDC159]
MIDRSAIPPRIASARAVVLSAGKVVRDMTVLDSPIPRFHLAVPVDDLDAARRFYGEVLGLEQGRSADTWIDWNLHGHQFVTHLAPNRAPRTHNQVDGHDVPVPHFGLLLTVPAFHELADRLRAAGTEFVIEPYLRFAGRPGEQWTMFLLDPAGNALEFKAFADDSQVFAV